MLPRLFLLLFLLAGLCGPVTAHAASVAVFPVEDLSRGKNSVNFELTGFLAEGLADRGLEVVPGEAVIDFMAENRVRWLGYLDTDLILQARDALGVDLLLFGTVCQKREKTSPAFGLSLYLVRTVDAKTIWSNSGGLSLADMQRLLGLFEPTSLAELWPHLARNVLDTWPGDLDEAMAQPLVFDQEQGEQPPALGIEDVKLYPRYVRPGEQVKCSVRLSSAAKRDEVPQIYIKVGSRVHLAKEASDGLYYEATWTGSEIEKGIYREVGDAPLNLAMQDLDTRFFEGIWSGADRDDRYPVSLVLSWPSGEQQIAFLGYYTVDSRPPRVALDVKGKVLQGEVTFRDQVLILPSILDREPFSRWQIMVENESGSVVMGQKGKGQLPYRFVWKGQQSNGFPVQEGRYRIVLKVWDRAGNEGETSQSVAFRPNPPVLEFDAKVRERDVKVQLTHAGDIPLAFWRLEMWSNEGDLLKQAEGDDLPADIDVPLPGQGSERDEKIQGMVFLRDILGNETRMEFGDLLLLAMRKKDSDESETSEAADDQEDESDSWVWLSEF